MYPNHISSATTFIKALNNPEFFHLGYDYKRADGTLIRKVDNFNNDTQHRAMYDNILSCNGVFIRKDIALQYPFEEDRKLASSEDWELWIRLLSRYPFRFSNQITSTIVSHNDRSIRTIPSLKLIDRDLLLIEKLSADKPVIQKYGNRFKKFVADRFTYFMLSLAEEGNYKQVWSWAFRAFKTYPLILGNRRFLASLKKTVLR